MASSKSPRAASHTNRFGRTYYLHEGVTKNGRSRYFVRKAIGDGARATMPDGYEFAESVQGVVSVRRSDPSAAIPPGDLALVLAELARHEHLRAHTAESVPNAIVVHEPLDGFAECVDLVTRLGRSTRGIPSRAPRYTPVMKFERTRDGSGEYVAHRMTYSGDRGWMPLHFGPLSELLPMLRAIGTDAFFDLC